MLYTLLDVAISPMEEFMYSAQNSKVLPIALIVSGVIAVVALTVFFVKNRDDKNEQEREDKQ